MFDLRLQKISVVLHRRDLAAAGLISRPVLQFMLMISVPQGIGLGVCTGYQLFIDTPLWFGHLPAAR